MFNRTPEFSYNSLLIMGTALFVSRVEIKDKKIVYSFCSIVCSIVVVDFFRL